MERLNLSPEERIRLLGEHIPVFLQSKRHHPALILSGATREQRAEAARLIAQSLLCASSQPSGLACGRCVSCRRIENDAYPDVKFIATDEDYIRIDTIRQLCSDAYLSPLEGLGKVYILDECHKMNTFASNAFLKTLEEPATSTFFLLLTSKPKALLPTIVSRSLTFELSEVDSAGARGEEKEPVLLPTERRQIGSFVAKLAERDEAYAVLSEIQTQLRSHLLGELQRTESANNDYLFDVMDDYEKSVTLEWRLRSQANYALLVEAFLRESRTLF